MPYRFFLVLNSLAFCLFFCFVARAEVRVPGLFSSNMVLQRGTPHALWGWANPREQIKISVHNQKAETYADAEGNWKIKLASLPTGGPYVMTIKGENTITLTNILVGDIWICAGQSNMAWPLQLAEMGEEELKKAAFPQIRLMSVPERLSLDPEKEMDGYWEIASPAAAADFSAVAFFFGRFLQDSLNIPVGLIEVSWGGSPIAPWIRADKLQVIPGMAEKMEANKEKSLPARINALRKKLIKAAGPIPEKDPGIKEHWNRGGHDFRDWKKMQLPEIWEEAGLQELNGVLWFKKEFEMSREQARTPDVSLELGTLEGAVMTFFNGPLIGESSQEDSVNRRYSVPSYALRAGKNVIAVRLDDKGGKGGFSGSPEALKLKGAGWEIPLAGEWSYKVAEMETGLSPGDYPAGIYNAMIHPLIPFGIKGAIWYQGESDVNKGGQYRQLLPMLIKGWREAWEQGNFPFLVVQLPNYGKPLQAPGPSKWAELREAQLLTALHHPNTHMAVTIDIGEADNMHPRNKKEVGRRLALLALAKAYEQELLCSGPLYRECRIEQDKIRLFFDHTGTGLASGDRSGQLKGFAIAGEDGVFKWADACIEGHTVVVSHVEVKSPRHVRYAWQDNPKGINLYNSSGLPASPFRTDVPE